MRLKPEREGVGFMYYREQWRPVAVLVDCVGLTSVQTFCLVVFVFPAPCPLVSHRLCVCHVFYKGNGTECNQSHASVSDHGGTVSSALSLFLRASGGEWKATLSCVDCSHGNHRCKPSPSFSPSIHTPPPLTSLPPPHFLLPPALSPL